MNQRFTRAIALLCAATIVAVPCVLRADDAVQLRYKAKEGDRSIYEATLSTLVKQSVNGLDIDTKFEQTDVTTYVVKKIGDDGTIQLESRNERLKVEGDFGGGASYKFDSQSEDNDDASEIGAAVPPVYERLSGAILGLELSPVGKVKKVTGYTELLKDVLEGNPLGQRFAGGGTDAAAQSGFQDLFVIFKKEAVKPGDSWEEPYKIEVPQLGEFKGKRKYTFVGPDKVGETPTLKITIDVDLSGDLDIDMGAAKVTGTFETDSASGTVQFDPVTGRILTMTSEQTYSGDLTVTAGGNTTPVGFEQTLKINRKLIDKIPE